MRDKNTSVRLCAKNAGVAYAREGAYLWDTTVILMYSVLRRAAMTKFRLLALDFVFREDCSTTCQHLRVIHVLNLLEGGLEQLRHCLSGETGDTCFYPKPGWFSTDQATKSSRIS